MRSRAAGKKGEADEIIIHFFIVALVIYAILLIGFFLGLYTSKKTSIEDTELKITINRMVAEAATHDKETGRTYTGTIDPAMSSDRMERQMDYKGEKRIGARIKLGDSEITYNKKWLDYLLPRAGYDAVKRQQNMILMLNSGHEKARIEAVE